MPYRNDRKTSGQGPAGTDRRSPSGLGPAGTDSRNPSGRSLSRLVTYSAVLAALGLIFSYIEVLIPFNMGIPGVKLGIANLVVIVALYALGNKYAFAINMIRVVVAGLLFTGLFGMLYSLAGAILSFAGMAALKKTGLFSVTGVSLCGGVLHNLGQIIVAAVVISNVKVFAYFPVLIISGVISGAIIGIIAWLILRRLPANIESL